MTVVILPLVLLTLAALAIASLCSRKFEEALPVTVLGVMLLLYGFYAFDALRAGRIAVLAACTILPVIACARLIRQRSLTSFLKASVFTPQMALYLLLIVLFFFLSRHKLVGIWDELRLWGSLPKALHAYGTLQFGEGASLFPFSQSYPPAIPLLQYFFVSFSPVFSEGALYFTRAWFGLTLLLPLTRKMTWGNWHGLTAVAFLIVFVPFYLTTNDPDFAFYYESLYVDAPAGILCGYLCWLAMNDRYQDTFSTAAFAIAIAALTLTKDFGVLFGGLCLLGSLPGTIRAAKKGNVKSSILKFSVAAVALIVSYLSWQLLMRIYHVENYNTVTATIPSVQTLFTSFTYYASLDFSVNLSILSFSIPYGTYLLLLILLYTLLVYRRKGAFKQDALFILLRIIGYGGYFFAYVMMFRDDIAGANYPSVARYMTAMLLCETYVFLMTWMKVSRREGRFLHRAFPSLPAGGKAAAILLTVSLLALSIPTVQSFWKYDGGVYWDAEQATELVENNIEPADGELQDIWLVIGGDAWENSLLHHRVYFNLIGSGARIKTYILQTNITQSGLAYTPDTFLQALQSGGYAYVLLLYGDDEIQEEFGTLFPELIPYETDFLLYKVDPDDQNVSLVYVE